MHCDEHLKNHTPAIDPLALHQPTLCALVKMMTILYDPLIKQPVCAVYHSHGSVNNRIC